MNERRSLQLLAEKYEQVRETTSNDIRNQILSLYKQGVAGLSKPEDTNAVKLAKRFNLSTNTITRIIRQSGVDRPPRWYTQRGKDLVHMAQKIPPDQIKYINNLISQRDDQGIFQYSEEVIAKMVNEYTNAHPELEWYKNATFGAIHKYVIKWEEENIPGETRADFGIKRSNGGIWRQKPNLPDNAGTWQKSFGQLGADDTSYQADFGRGRNTNKVVIPPV